MRRKNVIQTTRIAVVLSLVIVLAVLTINSAALMKVANGAALLILSVERKIGNARR